jgi:tetratricopeptide (TPR) repeat protein/mono/diheme cytochrome c family protein
MKPGRAAALLLATSGALASHLVHARAEPPSPVTFDRDIAPLVFANCAACHRPGGAGPFSLLTYEDVRARAPQIAKVTQSRFMPPWLPEPGKGRFRDERRLSDAQIALLQRWVVEGAAEGNAADLPPAPKLTPGWALGEPDLVLTAKEAYPLRADGTDVFRNLVFEAPVRDTRFVRAIEIRLNDPKVGHHTNLLLDRTRAMRRLDAADPDVGFAGMEVATESEGFDPDSHFLFWKPGTEPYEEPPGMAWTLDPRTDLVLNMHLRPSGKPELVRPTIALYFTEKAPTLFPMLIQLEHDGGLDIPPGARDFAIADEYVLPLDVDVLAVYPHAHYLGKEVRGVATLPDGTETWLVHIRDWNVDWQGVFRYSTPVFLPRGTKISMRWSYDNSEDNVRNPNHPPRRVQAGNRAQDEMGHLWLQVLPRTGSPPPSLDPRIALQEALMRRRLVKYPRDFSAHYNLGAALQAEGKLEDAVSELRKALATNPGSALAHNNLGAALHARGDVDAAMAEYRQVLRVRPDDANAHNNLAQAFVSKGRLDEGIGHYREVLRLEPEDAGAHAQLGAVLQGQGKGEEAIPHLREALRVDPERFDARYNLGQALAARGEWPAAAKAFEEALARRPADPDARIALGQALLAQGRTDAAMPHLREALRSKPGDPNAHDALGQAAFSRGEIDEAILHFQEVARAHPDEADACNNLGSALAARGRLAEAASQFERALRLDPTHAAARANLERARAALRRTPSQ